MQPEPTELSTPFNTTSAPESDNASQYGFRSDQDHSADFRDPVYDEAGPSGSSSRAPDLIGSPLADGADVQQEQLRRLNLGSDINETRPKASFQRISEYEKALSPSSPRKHEGPGFKIIKRKGNRIGAPQLESFPNGRFCPFCSMPVAKA
jgi:hypothetical protein